MLTNIDCHYCKSAIELEEPGYGFMDNLHFHNECLEVAEEIPVEDVNVWNEAE